ncbi:MAG TPA: hypothetical protein VFK20_16270 [Vicinamibacterales bacterium]|nr:hypothetical protein [Vicinamibacterales bacterium]
MRNQMTQFGTALAAAIVAGALTAACSQTTDAGRETNARAENETAGRQMVKLEGCVQAGPGDQWRLQKVRLASPGEIHEEIAGASLERRPPIVDGSWVWIQTGPREDVSQYLGKQVSVIARIVNDGSTTIGTSGASPQATDRSAPPATAPPPLANANGTAPTIAINKLTTIADSCEIEQEEGREGITGMGGHRAPKDSYPAAGSHR